MSDSGCLYGITEGGLILRLHMCVPSQESLPTTPHVRTQATRRRLALEITRTKRLGAVKHWRITSKRLLHTAASAVATSAIHTGLCRRITWGRSKSSSCGKTFLLPWRSLKKFHAMG